MAKQSTNSKSTAAQGADSKVRLDKWLWAARFFKTRAIAKQAVEGGKVHYEGQRAKCSRIVEVGAELIIRQGFDEKKVIIVAISEQRRGASEAQLLYNETSESQAKRELSAEQRKAMRGNLGPDVRPNKRDRRRIMQFKDQ
ncbi:ribosome-associated heat shock protein Hsp15 [Aliamphritea ceti]|uniref:ribosome-associated heat shock protein Hsp15 n=1 Tax=Aliamphritea ceti TaxID=1524258 RepID=UPI0021C3EC0D|nr:ribosome-associated heat shock protein Hsp15 [Aliamphritea ceti]